MARKELRVRFERWKHLRSRRRKPYANEHRDVPKDSGSGTQQHRCRSQEGLALQAVNSYQDRLMNSGGLSILGLELIPQILIVDFVMELNLWWFHHGTQQARTPIRGSL